MPWKEMSTMDQRLLFIADYLSGDYTKKALCIYYGIRAHRRQVDRPLSHPRTRGAG